MLRPSAARQTRHNGNGVSVDDGDYLPLLEKKRNGISVFQLSGRVPIDWKHLLLVLVVVFALKVAMRYEVHRVPAVPDPVRTYGISPDSVERSLLDTDQFIVARARRALNELTSFGVRLAGTQASEEMAVPWLLRELDNLRNQLKKDSPYKLTFSADYVSGFYDLGFLSGFTSVYANVSNVLARLDPVGGDTKNALLINSHYDTHFETVGASDDAVNIAIMLEILRALLSSPTPLRHSVIFLFNGAEENILQASNGFVAGSSNAAGNVEGAGHPWAKDVRAFINLEAAGSGGREILFQTGPGPATPILVRAYGASAPYPFAHVIGQELFQLGLIPSDTDFRIFRDHGRIPGIDFAFYTNGFVYHTRYDTPERIPDGSIQRAGSNIMAVARELASSDLSTMPAVHDPNDRSGEKLVYFDVFSTFFFVYPFWTVGIGLNCIAAGGAVWRVLSQLCGRNKREGVSYGLVFIAALFGHVFALAVGGGVSFLTAHFLSQSSACMCWYARTWLLVPIYALPPIAAVFAVHSIFFKYLIVPSCSTANFGQKCEASYDVSYDAAYFLTSLGIVAASMQQLASSYILCMWVLWPLCASLIMDRFVPLGRGVHNCRSALLFRHASMTLIPTLYFMYISDGVYEIFIPITGRVGGLSNPEIMISTINFGTMALLLVYHCPLVYLCGGRVGGILKMIAVSSGLVAGVVLFTPFGHPYRVDIGEQTGVRCQRSAVQFTMQKVINAPGTESLVKIRSGLWYVPLDYNGLRALSGLSPLLDSYVNNARQACSTADDLTQHPYCGLPFVMPLSGFVGDKTYWIDVEPSPDTLRTVYWPAVHQMPTSPMMIAAGRWLVQYRIDCGDTPHCSVYISPFSHAAILSWHFSNDAAPINRFPMDKMVRPPIATINSPRDTWFVLLRFGSSNAATRLQQRSIILTMEVGASGHAAASGRNLLEIAIVSQYFRGSSSNKELREFPIELKAFVSALPDWHCSIPLTSLYASYGF